MPLCHRKMSRRLACKVDGCDKKGITLSIAGDPYSDRVCVEHFAQTEAFFSRGPCVDCGLKREDHPVSNYWSLARCSLCQRTHRHTDPKWLERPPCEMCGVTRDKDNSPCSWDKVCTACAVYFRNHGIARPQELEAHQPGTAKLHGMRTPSIVTKTVAGSFMV